MNKWRMNGWMNEWMIDWLNIWWMDGWMNDECMDEWMDGWMRSCCICVNGFTVTTFFLCGICCWWWCCRFSQELLQFVLFLTSRFWILHTNSSLSLIVPMATATKSFFRVAKLLEHVFACLFAFTGTKPWSLRKTCTRMFSPSLLTTK